MDGYEEFVLRYTTTRSFRDEYSSYENAGEKQSHLEHGLDQIDPDWIAKNKGSLDALSHLIWTKALNYLRSRFPKTESLLSDSSFASYFETFAHRYRLPLDDAYTGMEDTFFENLWTLAHT